MWGWCRCRRSEFHQCACARRCCRQRPANVPRRRIAGCGGCVLQGEGACRSDFPPRQKIFDRNSQPSQRQVRCFCVVKALALGFKALGHKGVGGGGGLRQAHGFVHRLGGSQALACTKARVAIRSACMGVLRIFGFCCMQWRVVLSGLSAAVAAKPIANQPRQGVVTSAEVTSYGAGF